jgi:hypothetical protein
MCRITRGGGHKSRSGIDHVLICSSIAGHC